MNWLRILAGRLRDLRDRYRARHPDGLGAGRLLTGLIVLLVLAGVGGISLAAIDLLNDLADDQGLARVEIGVVTAREDLRQVGENTLTAARILAARSTLQRLLAERRRASVTPFLRRFCETGGIDACAVVLPGTAPLVAGRELDWPALLDAATEQGERFLAVLEADQPALLGARATLPDGRGEVLLVRLLDERLAADLTQRVGVQVRILNYLDYAGGATDEFRALHSAALAGTGATTRKIRPLRLYAASMPVEAVTGEVVALLETRLPAAVLTPAVERLIRRLLLIALVVGLLAVTAGLILGRRISSPLRALTRAAGRLGGGDFSTSIPVGGVAEISSLGRTMEDMRQSLLDLTGALRQREAEAQALLGGIVEGVFAVDPARRIRYLNPRAAELLGIDPGAAVGQFCGDVLRPRPGPDGRRPCEQDCPILRARASGSSRATEELAPTGGPPRTTVITSAGPVDQLQVQVIRDETDLEAVRRARDSVLANISHEFRTPLAAQLASIELLRDGLETLEPGARRELVLSLERGTLRLTRLIDNLLESVRIEAGQLALRRSPVGLAELVESARGLVEALLIQRQQTLEVALPDDLPPIHGDGPRLVQVLVNLLANASKFGPEGSVIRIGAGARDGRVEFWVEDEGPGVPEPASGSIFDRFYRGPEVEPEPGGLGLGLWIIRSIVDRHGGTIDAVRTPGGLTRFRVSLPAAASQ